MKPERLEALKIRTGILISLALLLFVPIRMYHDSHKRELAEAAENKALEAFRTQLRTFATTFGADIPSGNIFSADDTILAVRDKIREMHGSPILMECSILDFDGLQLAVSPQWTTGEFAFLLDVPAKVEWANLTSTSIQAGQSGYAIVVLLSASSELLKTKTIDAAADRESLDVSASVIVRGRLLAFMASPPRSKLHIPYRFRP